MRISIDSVIVNEHERDKGPQISVNINPAGSIVVYFSNPAIVIPVILGCPILESFPKAAPQRVIFSFPGMILEKGCPKSLFRPGSSTVILLFEPSRIRFSPDLRRNLYRTDAASRYSAMLDRALVETEVRVRSTVATARSPGASSASG